MTLRFYSWKNVDLDELERELMRAGYETRKENERSNRIGRALDNSKN